MKWTPGFEVRELKRERGLLCVREAADSWARLGRASLKDEVFVAVFIRLLLAPETYRTLRVSQGSTGGGAVPDLPIRPLEEWLSVVGTPVDECRRREIEGPRAIEIAGELCRRVSVAADQWSLGNPEIPPTDGVFKELARILADRGALDWWGESPGAKP